jgi:hypothetical protein
MTVYFEPQRRGWMDYAMPIVMQILGNGMERSKQAKAYELEKRAADEAMARRQQEADFNASRLYGTEKTRPLNGIDQALNVAGYTPGGPLPAMNEAYRDGGLLNGMDMRGNPSDAFARISAGASFMPEEYLKQLGIVMPNLNAPVSAQEYNLGDRKLAGTLDPSTGAQNLQAFDVGLNPDVADTNASGLAAQKIAADAQVRAAQIGAAGRGGGQAAQRPSELITGADGQYYWVDPYSQSTAPANLPQAPEGMSPTLPIIADLYKGFEEGRGMEMDGRAVNPWEAMLMPLLNPQNAQQMPQPSPEAPTVPIKPQDKGLFGSMISAVKSAGERFAPRGRSFLPNAGQASASQAQSDNRPAGWSAADESALQKGLANGWTHEEFMRYWKQKRGAK